MAQPQKKIFQNALVASFVVPTLIVLFGALLVFSVSRMLSSDRTYRDLVQEIQSKSFGNKWAAAYELSKQINATRIPEADYPWLVENLGLAYRSSQDARTRGFVIAALGALKTQLSLPILQSALADQDVDVQFHAIVSIANMPKGFQFDWPRLMNVLTSEAVILRQSALLALATHQVQEAKNAIGLLMKDQSIVVRYAAATALISYKEDSAARLLKEILLLPYPSSKTSVVPPALDAQQITNLKLGVLESLQMHEWTIVNDIVTEVAQKDANRAVSVKAEEVLNLLK